MDPVSPFPRLHGHRAWVNANLLLCIRETGGFLIELRTPIGPA